MENATLHTLKQQTKARRSSKKGIFYLEKSFRSDTETDFINIKTFHYREKKNSFRYTTAAVNELWNF